MSFPIPQANIRYLGWRKKTYVTPVGVANTAFDVDVDEPCPQRHFRVVLRASATLTLAGAAATGYVSIVPYHTKTPALENANPYWLQRTFAAVAVGAYYYALPNIKDNVTGECQQTPFILDEFETIRLHSDQLGAGCTAQWTITMIWLEFERLD